MSSESLQAVYDAAKRFVADVENLGGLRTAMGEHDAALAATAAPEATPEVPPTEAAPSDTTSDTEAPSSTSEPVEVPAEPTE